MSLSRYDGFQPFNNSLFHSKTASIIHLENESMYAVSFGIEQELFCKYEEWNWG